MFEGCIKIENLNRISYQTVLFHCDDEALNKFISNFNKFNDDICYIRISPFSALLWIIVLWKSLINMEALLELISLIFLTFKVHIVCSSVLVMNCTLFAIDRISAGNLNVT